MPTANHTMQPEKEEAEHRVHGSFLKELHVLLLLASHSLQVSHVASSSCKGGRWDTVLILNLAPWDPMPP